MPTRIYFVESNSAKQYKLILSKVASSMQIGVRGDIGVIFICRL
jgi:hypothetical protein